MFGEQGDRGAVIYKSKIYYIHSEFGKKKNSLAACLKVLEMAIFHLGMFSL